jgi:hypothetical protein
MTEANPILNADASSAVRMAAFLEVTFHKLAIVSRTILRVSPRLGFLVKCHPTTVGRLVPFEAVAVGGDARYAPTEDIV